MVGYGAARLTHPTSQAPAVIGRRPLRMSVMRTDGRDISERSDAVLRTAMPDHDKPALQCYPSRMLRIETERDDDGRWLAEVPGLPVVLSYGATTRSALQGHGADTAGDRRTGRKRRRASARTGRQFPMAECWPAAKAQRVLAALLRIGWIIKRQSGSHRTLPTAGLAGLRVRV